MATSWPKKRRLLGTKVQRLDGPAKATGTAKYSFDVNRPGMLQALMLRSPHAHAKITSLDTAAAEKMPGVRAVYLVRQPGEEVFYAGDEVLALAADTEEHAADALRAVRIVYEVLPHIVKEEDALREDLKTVPPIGPKKERNNVRPPLQGQSENFDKGMAAAEVTHEGTYGVPTICHQCLESHGLVAEWDKDGGLTVWASTQAVAGTADQLAKYFAGKYKIDLPASKVKCITQYMGGGFGSKFGPDIQGQVAAELARKAGAPVKLMLDRASEVTAGGNRPSAFGKVKIGATRDGKVTAYEVDCYGTPGVGNSPTVTFQGLPYVFGMEEHDNVPTIGFKRKHTIIRTNAGQQRAMRAPNHPQNSILTDCALDDLAAKLNMDPLQVRLRNLPQNDADALKNAPHSLPAMRNTIYTKEIEIAAQLSGWKEKWHPPGKGPSKGPFKHGIGMALHTWGGQSSPQLNECTVLVSSDGSVTARSSTQDLGTGQRTVTALVTAEILGLEINQITVQIGDSTYGASSGSGGSTTIPSQAPATLRAATAARDDLFTKIAPKLNTKPENLVIEPGKIRDTANDKTYEWKKACALLGMNQAKGTGSWVFADTQKPENKDVASSGVGGVQVAEVLVDIETGLVRCTQIVAVQDCGLVVSKLTCESQVAGGVIMGVNLALFEERIMDRATGRQVNPNMEFYKLGGIEDMPKIIVHLHDMPERGVIGIGEPPTISTHSAISNAIFNAIGVRVPHTPFTPDRVLAALEAKGGKG
jgi:xanthine dehydrogenase YagR molybdenum-binding subunit